MEPDDNIIIECDLCNIKFTDEISLSDQIRIIHKSRESELEVYGEGLQAPIKRFPDIKDLVLEHKEVFTVHTDKINYNYYFNAAEVEFL